VIGWPTTTINSPSPPQPYATAQRRREQRDDMNVMSAMVFRLDGTVAALIDPDASCMVSGSSATGSISVLRGQQLTPFQSPPSSNERAVMPPQAATR